MHNCISYMYTMTHMTHTSKTKRTLPLNIILRMHLYECDGMPSVEPNALILLLNLLMKKDETNLLIISVTLLLVLNLWDTVTNDMKPIEELRT